jgi:hypothetical protein
MSEEVYPYIRLAQPPRFSTKISKVCPDCGSEFMSYAYHKLRRCELCRTNVFVGEETLEGGRHGEEPKYGS